MDTYTVQGFMVGNKRIYLFINAQSIFLRHLSRDKIYASVYDTNYMTALIRLCGGIGVYLELEGQVGLYRQNDEGSRQDNSGCVEGLVV